MSEDISDQTGTATEREVAAQGVGQERHDRHRRRRSRARLAHGVQHELSAAIETVGPAVVRQPPRAVAGAAGNRRPSSRTAPHGVQRAPQRERRRNRTSARTRARSQRRSRRAVVRRDANAASARASVRAAATSSSGARGSRRRRSSRGSGVVMSWPFYRSGISARARPSASPSASASAARARASRWRAASGRIASTAAAWLTSSPSTPTSSSTSRCISGSAASARSRSRQPGSSRGRRARTRSRRARAASGAGAGDVGAPARRHETVARDGEDPGRQVGVGRQPRRVPRDREPDLLVQILGDVAPPGETQQEAEARLREARVKLAERRAIAPPQAIDQRRRASGGPSHNSR